MFSLIVLNWGIDKKLWLSIIVMIFIGASVWMLLKFKPAYLLGELVAQLGRASHSGVCCAERHMFKPYSTHKFVSVHSIHLVVYDFAVMFSELVLFSASHHGDKNKKKMHATIKKILVFIIFTSTTIRKIPF